MNTPKKIELETLLLDHPMSPSVMYIMYMDAAVDATAMVIAKFGALTREKLYAELKPGLTPDEYESLIEVCIEDGLLIEKDGQLCYAGPPIPADVEAEWAGARAAFAKKQAERTANAN